MKGPMADYYTNFSFYLPLPDPAQKEHALNLAQIATVHRFENEQLPADFPQPLQDVLEEWNFELEEGEDGLWIHSDSGGVDAVCAFIQHLLQKFNLPLRIGFEWSHDCSKPRTDAFGGGAALISAQEIKIMSTGDWLVEQTTHVFSQETRQCIRCGVHADDDAVVNQPCIHSSNAPP